MTKVSPFNKFTSVVLFASIAVVVLSAVIFVLPPKEIKVVLGRQEVYVVIADTPVLQERGLSGYKKLNENEGMLFVFDAPARVGFWMKDMLFPIDIIWFDENRRIVDVWENASPESYPQVHTPPEDSLYVLEVRSGFFKDHALKFGDVLEFESSARYTK